MLRASLDELGVEGELRRAMERLRAALEGHERDVESRNAQRRRPFLRMRPTQWELSASF